MTVEAIDYDLLHEPSDISGSRLKVVPLVGSLATKEAGSTPLNTTSDMLVLPLVPDYILRALD